MMTERIDQCYLCGDQLLDQYKTITDHFGSKESFPLIRCKKCETVYTNPRPDQNSILTYYKSNGYISHGDKVTPIFDKLYRTAQSINFKSKKRILEKYTLNRQHLDYGCGNGAFLNFLRKNQWGVDGIEPDVDARNNALDRYSLSLKSNYKELSEDKLYSSISLFHVLEHVHSLEETLQALITRLDKNGVLVLALPNYKSHDAQHYGDFWAGYDVPRHLYHFSQKSIHQLAKTFGLNIVATHPMIFDSYYVSLLSEQYRTGRKKYASAILRGYQSNRKAKSSGEYSSLIYILSP